MEIRVAGYGRGRLGEGSSLASHQAGREEGGLALA